MSKRLIKLIGLATKCRDIVSSIMLYVILDSIAYCAMTQLVVIVTNCVNADLSTLYHNICILGVCAVIEIVANFGSAIYSKTFVNKFYLYYTKRFYEKILLARYDMFVKINPAKLVTLFNSVKELRTGLQVIVAICIQTLKIAILVVTIYNINSTIVLYIVIPYLVCAPLIRALFSKIDSFTSITSKKTQELNKEVSEIINGFAEVRAFNRQKSHASILDGYSNSIVALWQKKTMLCGISDAYITLVSYIPLVLCVVISVREISAGSLTTTAAISIVMLVWRIINPVINVIDLISMIADSTEHLDDFIEVLNYTEESDNDGDIELKNFNNSIAIEDLSFSYNDSDTVLKDINLSIKKGQKIGICGEGGGGKSTLLKLIPRFYDTFIGSIKFDGIDSKELTVNSLRKHIASVSQDIFIMDSTIYDNIVYGTDATESEVVEACKKASIYDFITKLPEGFKTNVGPKGLKLSGGQKQRIALARVFLSKADIILLDEATSALDNESELIVKESMDLLKDKTMIIVAHRLTTIKNCDNIVVINEHSIVEHGTHEELLNKHGIYARLYRV